jgi:hypothetical protein
VKLSVVSCITEKIVSMPYRFLSGIMSAVRFCVPVMYVEDSRLIRQATLFFVRRVHYM